MNLKKNQTNFTEKRDLDRKSDPIIWI